VNPVKLGKYVYHPLPDYCESRGIHLKREGRLLVGLCPFHSEKSASFTIYPDNHYCCYGCGRYGDVTDLERALGGGTPEEAVERLGEVPRTYTAKQQSGERATRQPYQMSEHEAKQCDLAALSLMENPAAIADWRNWKTETIADLATTGDLGLREDKLAFLFSTGMKVRTLEKGKDKKVWWEFGQTSLWRGECINESTKRVIVAEGEIDAITLIDCGIEADGQTRVVALPGAIFNLTDSLPLLKDKSVVLVPDLDDAGIAALRKNLDRLRGVASQLYQMDIRLDDSATDVKDLTELRDAREGLTVEEIESRFQLADPVFNGAPEPENQYEADDGLPDDADLCEFMTQTIEEPKHLLQGLFRKGQVMIISGASKTYKS
jgi:hypothetical protein